MNTEKVATYIIQWLKDYCQQSGLKGFVVGVSGGIDSAVTSTLCAKTGLPTYVLSMPIRQKADQHSLSQAHCQWLAEQYDNVTAITQDLTSSFEALEAALPADIQDGLTMANARSRLRMLTLYTFAGHHRCLVGGTGNKVEDFGVGFYTKYGDGGVDVSPIADLMKSEVYAIAAHLGVMQGIQEAAPTDGLWEDDRTDEGQLGASYDELEWAMTASEDANLDRSTLSERQREVLDIYTRHHNANKHKMEPIPVCIIPRQLKAN